MLFVNEIVPIFTKNGCAVYMNLTPHVTQETSAAIISIPQQLSKTLTKLFLKHEVIFDKIILYDIGIYNEKSNSLESVTPSTIEEPNSTEFFEMIKCLSLNNANDLAKSKKQVNFNIMS